MTNCIFWDNDAVNNGNEIYNYSSADPNISYCDIKDCGGSGGGWDDDIGNDDGGNIDDDPLFANSANDDFHLKSAGGRWNGTDWTNDAVTSPCVNGGDPSSNCANEPSPNGDRINIGAYGYTAHASKSSKYHLVVYLATDDDESLSADMQWQLAGLDSVWRDSAEAVLADAGNYTIKCQCNTGTYYIPADDLSITIGENQPISYTRTYNACGYIIYNCYYYNDFGTYTGAGWRVEGGGSWHNGQKKYVPGNYSIDFMPVSEHITPSGTNVTVTKGSTNSGQSKGYQRSTFYVDMEYGNNNNRGGSMNQYLTIQKAFDMVPSGGYIWVQSNYATKYEGVDFPSISRRCTIRSYSNLTVRGDHTPNDKPWYITAIGIIFEEL